MCWVDVKQDPPEKTWQMLEVRQQQNGIGGRGRSKG